MTSGLFHARKEADVFLIKLFAVGAALWLFFIFVIAVSLFMAVISNNFGAFLVLAVFLYYILRKGSR